MDRERLIGWLRTYADSYEGSAVHRDIMRLAADALSQPEERQAPNGWVLVPIEPTDDMMSAGAAKIIGCNSRSNISWQREAKDAYKAMLAAAATASHEE